MCRYCGNSLFDEYGLRKLCFLRERLPENDKDTEFSQFSPKGKNTGGKIATACYMEDYFLSEDL